MQESTCCITLPRYGNDNYDDQWLMAVREESLNATLTVNDRPVRFQLDGAADVNTICQKHARKHKVSPTTVRLNMWNKINLKPLGETGTKGCKSLNKCRVRSKVCCGAKWLF